MCMCVCVRAQEEVVAFGCELLGVPTPPLVEFEEAAKHMSAMALSFYAENKRVANKRMHVCGVTVWVVSRARSRANLMGRQ